MGITAEEQIRFWKKIDVRAINTGKPKPTNTTIVDVKTISLVNRKETEMNCSGEGKEKEGACDAYNEVEISSKGGSNQPSQETYRLSLGDMIPGEIGELINVKLSESNFYNSPSAPITFKTGGDLIKNAAKEKDGILDKCDYQVTECIQVPPKTKVTATILKKCVTYELQIVAEFRLNADAHLPIRFKGRVEKKLGSFCTATVRSVTAKDMFCNEAWFKEVDGVVTFRREGTLSYTGEEVEIITDMKEI